MSTPDPAQSLLAALQSWAQQALPAPPSGHAGPECQWCPLCQLASVLRGEHPEITERMAEAGAAVSAAVRLLLESTGAARTSAHEPKPDMTNPSMTNPSMTNPGTTKSGAARPRPRVERVVLDDDSSDPGTAEG